MLINYDWLREYCDAGVSAEEAAKKLTAAGLNVESLRRTDRGDPVLDVEVTANRNDCNSYVGVARELSVLTGHELMLPPLDVPAERTDEMDDVPVSVSSSAEGFCPRYTARIVRDVDVGPSPDWLARRVESMGVQSVNNIVDITNYVLFETGQPLHAFDVSRLAGPEIVVRPAREDEEITALNDETYELDPEVLVIADGASPVAVAGVIGGRDTEVRKTTSDVLIESALFDPVSVRRTSRQLGVSTESSYRFERGPDPEQVEVASRRAAWLMQEVAGGRVEPLYVDRNDLDAEDRERPTVSVRPDRVEELLGVEISRSRQAEIYEALGFEPQETSGDEWTYRVPSFRTEVSREEDLIEEAARIHGYDRIPTTADLRQSFAAPPQTERVRNRVRHLLSGQGYNEILTFPILDGPGDTLPSYWTPDDPVGIVDAEGNVDRYLRRSLVPSVLDVLDTNHGYGKEDLTFFEVARAYRWGGDREPDEQAILSLIREDDFRRLKGDVELFLEKLIRRDVQFESFDHDLLADAYAAEIWLGRQPLGYLGKLDPTIAERRNLQVAPFLCELDFDLLKQRTVLTKRFEPFSRFPPSPKDLSFIVDEQVSWQELRNTMSDAGPSELESVEMFDVFRGGDIPDGRKSVAVRLTFRSSEKTLERPEINDWMRQVVERVEESLPAELRGDLD